jgi:glutathione S-transferase
MAWVNLISLLAVVQFFGTVWLVGRARVKYGVRAPATTGNEQFERCFRIQQNTLETLIMFLPALWISAQYWTGGGGWIALIGLVYLVGRTIYIVSYMRDPRTRTLGYMLSIGPVGVLVVLGLAGVIKSIL